MRALLPLVEAAGTEILKSVHLGVTLLPPVLQVEVQPILGCLSLGHELEVEPGTEPLGVGARSTVSELEVAAHLHDILLANVAGGDHLADEVVVVLLVVAERLSPEVDELVGVSGVDRDLEAHGRTLGPLVACATIVR